ncbi:restriction endonuclease subunit S [Saprospiraceae bacterium]|nr:restriction endonuclease subunit S [Saprospiraceae bacterium]
MSTATTHIETDKQLVPAIRFKEFDGDWEKKKLGDVGKIRMCKRIFSSDTTEIGDIPFYKIGTFGKQADAYITNELYLDYRERFSFPKIGDILMSASGTLGRTVIYDGSPSYYQDSNIVWIDNEEEVITNSFLFYIYQIVRYDSEGGTIQRLYNSIINNAKFSKPILPEQQKIASFLSAVDEKIQQLTKKKELLEQYKKGVMQQLFSGQLRFKAENGNPYPDWEEKTLLDVASFRRGSFPQPYGLPEWYDDNGAPFVQVYDVAKNMLLKPKTKQYISEAAQKQSVFVKKGTLVLTIQGSIGRLAKTQYDAYVDRTLLIFQSYKVEMDIDYFKYVVYILFEIEKTKAPGGTIKTITKEKLSSFNVNIPCIEEQQKIATYLSSIDTKIEKVNNQITQTKIFKKGLLQQMFV